MTDHGGLAILARSISVATTTAMRGQILQRAARQGRTATSATPIGTFAG